MMSENPPARRLDETFPMKLLKSQAPYRTFVSEG